MDALFRIQLPILLFFQNIDSIFLDFIAEIITFFGESPIPLLVTIFIYWCIDKRKGFLIVSSLMSGMMSMQILKAIFRIPRPFMYYNDLIAGKRQATATGFSFPSGHSTTASAFYAGLESNFKIKWLKVLCIILIILVPVSRVYLGVHWPLDVIIGTLIGLVSVYCLKGIFNAIYDNERRFFLFCICFGIVAMILALPLATVLDITRSQYSSIELFKTTDIYRCIHNLMQNSAIASGLFLGMIADRKYLRFIPAIGIQNRILSILVGLIGAGILAFVLLSIPFAKYLFEFIAYALVGLWVTFLFPLISSKLGFMKNDL